MSSDDVTLQTTLSRADTVPNQADPETGLEGPPGRGKKNRDYVFTLNRWTEAEREAICQMGTGIHTRYLVFGEEVGENGTPHLQGFIQFKNARSFAAVKKDFGRSHIESRRGTPQEAADYCKKDATNVREFGEIRAAVGQGTRTDIDSFCASLKRGSSMADASADQPAVFVKYHRGLKEWAGHNRCYTPRTWKSIVIVLVGDAGVGKTRWAHAFARRLGLPVYIKAPGSAGWWDRYLQEPVVVLDDFHGGIPFGELKVLLDRFPHQVPIKGAFVEFNPRYIIITSNKNVCDWYSTDVCTWTARGICALYRRLDVYRIVRDDGWHLPWENDFEEDMDFMRCSAVKACPEAAMVVQAGEPESILRIAALAEGAGNDDQ